MQDQGCDPVLVLVEKDYEVRDQDQRLHEENPEVRAL